MTKSIDYVGIKKISATPMRHSEYLAMTNKPSTGGDDSDGYHVTYPDGYVSWSPKNVFEEAYKRSGEMSYSAALYLVQTEATKGAAMYRSGWNGSNMYVLEIDGGTLAQGIDRNYGDPSNPENNAEVSNALFLKNAQGKLFPWFPSQGDTNANDWCIKYL